MADNRNKALLPISHRWRVIGCKETAKARGSSDVK
jgi:hypothetical protein